MLPTLKPHGTRKLTLADAFSLSESARTLGEVSHNRAKARPEPAPEWTCSHCLKGQHWACVSKRCSCGAKHL